MLLGGVQVRGAATGFGTRKGELLSVQIFGLCLPPPTLNDSRPQPADEDEPTIQPIPDHTTELPTLPTLSAVSDAPAPILPTTASPEATHEYGPTTTPHPRITMRLPGCWVKRPSVEFRDESNEYKGSEDEAIRPIYDVLYVPYYPVRSTVAPCSF